MPRSSHYNKIDDRQRQKFIESIFNEGETIADTAKRFGFPDFTARSIAKAFETKGAMTELDNHPDLPIADLRNRLIDHFPFQRPPSMTTITRAVRDLAGYTLKLMCYEFEDYNSAERIQT
ncbi:hypothetical protein HDV00_006947, partial [Rhizophlyctis rosea]